jgi:hypothetical protein
MPLELQIIRAREFIKLGVQGGLDLAGSREMLRQLASACRKRGIDQALLDLRDLHPGPTPLLSSDDLATLVNTFHEIGFSERQRLAVLYSEDPHYGARIFAFISTLRGWNVKALDKFEDAMLWLSQGQDEERTQEGAEVPLQFKKPAEDQPERIQVMPKPDPEDAA